MCFVPNVAAGVSFNWEDSPRRAPYWLPAVGLLRPTSLSRKALPLRQVRRRHRQCLPSRRSQARSSLVSRVGQASPTIPFPVTAATMSTVTEMGIATSRSLARDRSAPATSAGRDGWCSRISGAGNCAGRGVLVDIHEAASALLACTGSSGNDVVYRFGQPGNGRVLK